MTKLQRMQRFSPSIFFNPQLSQTIMSKLAAHQIRTHSIRKLSTDILNGITRSLLTMKYKQCPKSDNEFDVDIYETNDMGFDEVVHCCTEERVRKSRR